MKLLIIGFGALGRYIVPCCRRLLGDRLGTDLLALKGTEKELAALNARYPFPVRAGGNAEALREMRPDVVVLAVKPEQLREQLTGVLRPYLDALRAEGARLPDIYSFVADPPVTRYAPILGEGVNVACMIPCMQRTVGDYSTAAIGTSFMATDPARPWPEKNLAQLKAFLAVTGSVLEVAPTQMAEFIAMNCACHVMYEFNFTLQDALAARGKQVTLAQTGSTYRRAFRDTFALPAAEAVPYGEAIDVPGAEKCAEAVQRAWYEGVLDYTRSAGIDHDTAARHVGGSIELFHIEVQLGSRASLEESTRMHATPGGFTEKAIRVFEDGGAALCRKAVDALLGGEEPRETLEALRRQAERCVRETVEHGRTLGRTGKTDECKLRRGES